MAPNLLGRNKSFNKESIYYLVNHYYYWDQHLSLRRDLRQRYIVYNGLHKETSVQDQIAQKSYIHRYSWIKDSNRRVYAAMTKALDDSIGKIVSAFKQKGIWNETIVYFTTDNGGSSLYGGNNFPYRGIKVGMSCWEGLFNLRWLITFNQKGSKSP